MIKLSICIQSYGWLELRCSVSQSVRVCVRACLHVCVHTNQSALGIENYIAVIRCPVGSLPVTDTAGAGTSGYQCLSYIAKPNVNTNKPLNR